ncbi:hypothetical protein [uncultured Duncaniella sp.]|uniref:hypothetical protein n=1 Tax=uncultured Duncaniella sp. TaxID=2768039 RepID=UPI00266F051C|nr:hypothetical protein [uncultured Duncaniella sp.]
MLKTKHFLLSLCLVTVACSSNDGVSYPDGLPDTMKHQPNDGPLPEAMMKVDSANVCITLLGREIHQGEQFNVTLFSIADCNELSPVTLPSDGKVSLNLSLQGSTMLSMGLNDFEERLPSAWIAPGEDIDIYIDCRPDSLRTAGAATIYTTGTYSDLNGLMSTHYPLAHSISIFNAPDNAYAMTGDEYTAVILKAYNDSLNAINSDPSTPEMIRELQKITLKTDMAAMVTQLPIIIRYGIISAGETPDTTRLRLSDTNIANIVKSVGFDEPKLFMASGHPFAMSIENVDWASNGAAGTPLGDAGVYQKIARKASAGRLSDEDRNTVNNLSSTFYGDAVNAIDKEYQAKLKESMDIIQKVPDVSPEKSICTYYQNF